MQTGRLLSPLLGPLTFVLAFTFVVALVLLLVLVMGVPFAIPFVVVLPTFAELVDDKLLPRLMVLGVFESLNLPLVGCFPLPESVHLPRLPLPVQVQTGLLFE